MLTVIDVFSKFDLISFEYFKDGKACLNLKKYLFNTAPRNKRD